MVHRDTCACPPSLHAHTFTRHTCIQRGAAAHCGLLRRRWPFLVGFVVTGTIFFNIARGLTGAPAQAGATLQQLEVQPLEVVLTLVCSDLGRGGPQEIKCGPVLLLAGFSSLPVASGRAAHALHCVGCRVLKPQPEALKHVPPVSG